MKRPRTAVVRKYAWSLPASNRGYMPYSRSSGSDLNYSDVTITTTCNNATPLQLLNGLTMGTGVSNRIGRTAVVKSVQYRFVLMPQAGTVMEWFRYAVVWDATPNGVLPAVNDIWMGSDPTNYVRRENRERFQILKQGFCKVHGGQLVGNAYIDNEVAGYVKVNRRTQYNAGNAGTIGDINTGALYFMYVCNSGAAASNVQTFGNVRTIFEP